MLRRIFRSILQHGTNIRSRMRDLKKIRSHRKTTQSHVHINATNKIILGMVNNERQKRHLTPVIYDNSLELHALRWSKHMAHQRRLSHSGTILENVCMVPARGSPKIITREMFFCWRKSQQHWAWMMNPKITKAGFGYSIRDKYAYGAYAFDNPR